MSATEPGVEMRSTSFSWVARPFLASIVAALSLAALFAGPANADSQVLLGNQSIAPLADSNSPGQAEAFSFVAGSSGTASAINLYLDAQSTASTVVVGLYRDTGGQPDSLLAAGTTSSPRPGAWNSVSVDSASISAGSEYWVTILGLDGVVAFRDSNADSCSSVTSAQTNLLSLAVSWSGGSNWPTCSISAYVTGATASASPPPPPAAPSNTAPPVISGVAQQGQLVSTSAGSWTNSPTSFTYQWQDCDTSAQNCTDIPSATSSSYRPGSGDVGDTVVSVVTAANAGGSSSEASAPTAVVAAAPATGGGATTVFSDDFSGTSLSPAWTVISRHGEYAQNETECNVPQQVSVANNVLDVSTVRQDTTCGDFNLDGSVRHAPSVWPYATGDVQWAGFNFTYGTVTYRAKFPPHATGTWPAIWLLGSNCQATNAMTADVGYSTCPNLGAPGYAEIDMTECDTENWCQLALAQPSSFPVCGYPVDDSWHTFSLTWTRTAISMSVDGKSTGCNFTEADGYTIPSTPMFLIIQTQTGGVGGTPDDTTLPADLDVSSVTVTQP
jgi:hypothetical protein